LLAGRSEIFLTPRSLGSTGLQDIAGRSMTFSRSFLFFLKPKMFFAGTFIRDTRA
jgi:hypothetical protein